ncbi:MAG TPA: type II secretion system F family protein [Phycisphaerae bacterium]
MLFFTLPLLGVSVIAIGALFAWFRIRSLRGPAVVHSLALIVGQNLPLAAGLRAAAQRERKPLRRILERMAQRLERGDSLATSLRMAYPACPGYIFGAIQGAEEIGTLPSVLRALASDERQRPPSRGISPAVPYFLGMLLLVPLVVSAYCIFIAPKLKDIFGDFGVAQLPTPTRYLLAICGAATGNSAWPPIVLFTLIIGVVQFTLWRYLTPRVPDRLQWLPAAFDALAWHLPLARRVAQTRALARQLPVLQAAIRAGHDLPVSLRQAARVDANYFARRRLRRWADAIEAGDDPLQSARRMGLPAPLLAALRAGRDPGDLGAALAYLCAYYRGLSIHWEHVLASLLTPCVVLTWGACVGFVALAVILPIVSLTEAVMARMY